MTCQLSEEEDPDKSSYEPLLRKLLFSELSLRGVVERVKKIFILNSSRRLLSSKKDVGFFPVGFFFSCSV